MQSCELVATITAIACAIANNYSEDEIAVLSSAFNQLGDTLGTILAQESCITNSIASVNKNTSDSDSNKNTQDTNCGIDSSNSNVKNTQQNHDI